MDWSDLGVGAGGGAFDDDKDNGADSINDVDGTEKRSVGLGGVKLDWSTSTTADASDPCLLSLFKSPWGS